MTKEFVSLKIKIPAFITTLVLFAVLGTGGISFYNAEKQSKELVLEKNLLISQMIAEQIDLYLNNAKKSLEKSADYLSEHDDFATTRKELKEVFETYHYFDTVFYLNPKGILEFSFPYNPEIVYKDISGREYYKSVIRTKETTVGNVIMSYVLNEPHFNVATPILDPETNEIKGIIGSGVPSKNIYNIAKNAQEHFNGKIWVVDENGLIIVHPETEMLLKPTALKSVDMEINGSTYTLEELIKKREEGTGYYKLDGHTIYASLSFTRNYPFLVMVEQYEDSVLNVLYQKQQKMKNFILGILALTVFVGFWIARGITKPVGILTTGVKNIEKSVTNYKDIVITNNDEFGQLATSFNKMSLALKNKINELKESYQKVEEMQEYLLNVLASAPNGILIADNNGKITFCNKFFEQTTSFNVGEVIGLSLNSLWERISLRFVDNTSLPVPKNTSYLEKEAIITNKEGKEVPVSINRTSIYSEDKQVIGNLFFLKDLSSIKIMEEELHRGDRLKILGEMSASIIHEVGNPLAGIANLLEVVQEDFKEQGVEHEIVNILQEEVARLNTIVISFLDFTRSSTMKKGRTDPEILINSVLHLLNAEFIYKKIKVVKNYEKKLPKINLDQTKFKQVLINVLRNAIQAVDEKGTIKINVRKQAADSLTNSSHIEISIWDNGVGISKDDLSHVFDPFYTKKKGTGFGLGLTIAYKIIKEHNGAIELKSEPGKYTEFKIIIPT